MNVIEKIHNIITGYQKKEAKGFEAWTVTWRARYSKWYDDWTLVAKTFLNKEDAEIFVKSLKEAKKLLQYTENIHIEITKQE
jgi:hypothetical protein